MLNYETLKKKPNELVALTGLARREFEELRPAFATALKAAEEKARPTTQKRRRASGAGRKPGLQTIEDKLRFGLVYTQTYPRQGVQGQLFGMSQPSANAWIHFLLPVRAEALEALGVRPERDGQQVADHERRRDEARDLSVAGVERRRPRPKNRERQVIHYSGKKTGHYDQKVVVVNTKSKRVSFLSPTLPGAVHDQAIADHADIRYPPGATLGSELGFQG